MNEDPTKLTHAAIGLMDADALWPYLLKHVPTRWLFEAEASDYFTDPKPRQWHFSIDGNYYLEADLTVRDCGNESRGAGFVRGLMRHIAREGGVVTLGLFASRPEPLHPEPGEALEDYQDRVEIEADVRRDIPWCYDRWQATAMINGQRLWVADSEELALLRAFVAWKEVRDAD